MTNVNTLITNNKNMDKYWESQLDELQSSCEPRSTGGASTPSLRALHRLLEQIGHLIQIHRRQSQKVVEWSPDFDCNLGVKANGFRSFARISSIFLAQLLESVKKNLRSQGKQADMKELMEHKAGLQKIVDIFGYLEVIHELLRQGQFEAKQQKEEEGFNKKCQNIPLFPTNPDIEEPSIERLCIQMALTDFSALFGKSLGFHYNGDAREMARKMLVGMATFYDVHQNSSKFSNLMSSNFGLNYLMDSEALIKRLEEIKLRASVHFFQDFYNLPENSIVVKYNQERKHELPVDQVLNIPLEKVIIKDENDEKFVVPLPNYKDKSSNDGGVKARLIAPFRTDQSFGKCNCVFANILARSLCRCKREHGSDTIMFHVHGGGFIAQSSRSHLTYLKQWSKRLNVPILSIDYTLAPQGSFPLPSEEVFFAYCWMLKNFDILASSGKNIIMAGDSAGGNLCFGLMSKLIECKIRLPNHLATFYPSVLNQMYPSPSRLLALFDPFLMFPALLRCINAYADKEYLANGTDRTFHEELELLVNIRDPLLSPLLLSSSVLRHFPPTTIVTTDVDPCLDESVSMASKLHAVDVMVDLDVISGLPHGFLGMRRLSKECQRATDHVTEMLKQIVDHIEHKKECE